MKIVVFGNKENTGELITHLEKHSFHISHLVTLEQSQKEKIQISGVSYRLEEVCRSHDIAVHYVDGYALATKKDEEFFSSERFDVGLSFGWQRIIPKTILEQILCGVFGWHGSAFEFPNGRGRSPLNWSIRLGQSAVFHNCFRYEPGIDSGKIYNTEKITIDPHDYIQDLQSKAKHHVFTTAGTLLDTIKKRNLVLRPQPAGAHMMLPKLGEEDGWLQPGLMSVAQGVNICRSCSRPFPGSFVRCQGTKFLRIWRMVIISESEELINGVSYLSVTKEKRVLIGFRDGLAELTDYETIRENFPLTAGARILLD